MCRRDCSDQVTKSKSLVASEARECGVSRSVALTLTGSWLKISLSSDVSPTLLQSIPSTRSRISLADNSDTPHLYDLFINKAEKLTSDGPAGENGTIKVTTKSGAIFISENFLTALKNLEKRKRLAEQCKLDALATREQPRVELEADDERKS
eukprot:IDg1994t1